MQVESVKPSTHDDEHTAQVCYAHRPSEFTRLYVVALVLLRVIFTLPGFISRGLALRRITSPLSFGTHTLPMATAIKSHVGLIGRQYPDLGHYITSPNSRRLPEPLLGAQDIRLRANYLYGEHDPLLHPQPYDPAVPHLPLIPLPELDQILWIVPDETLFQPIDGFKLAAEPIGHLPKEMIEALEHEYMDIVRDLLAPVPTSSFSSIDSSSPPMPSARNDHKVKLYRNRIQYVLGHLTHEASNFSETLMAWRICQRACLELRARITWIQFVEPRWGVLEVYRVPTKRIVVGALTDRPEIAENCLRTGIPVWLYRRLPPHPDVVVDHWHTDDKPCQTLKAIVEPVVSFKDADPPYRVIYSGTCGTLKRYHSMAEHNEQLAFPGSAFDASPMPNCLMNQPVEKLPLAVETVHEQPSPLRVGPSKDSTTTRHKPYYFKQKIRNKRKHQHQRKLTAAETSSNPSPLLSCPHPSLLGSRRARKGYVLPDPGMLGGMDEKLYQPFLKMYLKLRPLLHYRVRKIGALNAGLSNGEWRKILGLGTFKESDGTQASKDRAKLIEDLQESLNGSGLKVDLTKLDTVVPEWEGQQFVSDLPSLICREILDEIIHFSFKSELLLADRFLYQFDPSCMNEDVAEEGQIHDDLAASNSIDRLQKVTSLPSIINGHLGFGSPNSASRQDGVYNLFRIMRGWGFSYGIPASMSVYLEQIGPGQTPELDILEHAEYLVALHYISTYADFFKRAPVIPHSF
ncbi:hypothetical protein FB446DRAFT_708600 [Lentinula raphanica]|nr:hypothetical protein FB446DRAFT_708600 [Lentinula raphanica]